MHLNMWSAICFNLAQSKTLSSGNGLTLYQTIIANFHGHALSAVSLINKSMKKSMSPVKVWEFPEFGELHLCVIANR